MGQHSTGLLLVITISWIIFVLALIFNGLAASGRPGVFHNATGDISNEFPTEVSPATWTFSIWWIIYFFQGGWMIYLLTTLFRQGPSGDYIYVNPGVIPWAVHVFFIAANTFNLIWLLLWDHKYFVGSFLIISLIPLSLFLATLLAVRALTHKTDEMIRDGLISDIWLNRILVHNGLAVYATWTAIATLVNLAIVLIYQSPLQVSNENASTTALAILTIELVVWSILDLALFDQYTRYLVTPYFVFFWALAGIADTDHGHHSRNRAFSIVLLILAIVLFALKIAMMLYRTWKTPGEESQPLNVRKSNIADK